MSGHPFVISRKVLHSICAGVDLIRTARFDETHIKLLLIDLRELARYFATRPKMEENIVFTKANKNFIDVCDFIAHASRNQGVMERMVREQVQRFHALPDAATVQDALDIPIYGVLRSDALVTSMAGIAYLALGATDRDRSADFLSAFATNSTEIELCIMSLLQDSMLRLKNGDGFASLHIQPRDGVLKLYCNVFDTKVEQDARRRTAGPGRLALSFPVMRSTVPFLDHPEFIFSTDVLSPAIYETHRTNTGRLVLRRIFHSFADPTVPADT